MAAREKRDENIAIIGAGRLGRSMALALESAGWPVCGLADLTREKAQRVAEESERPMPVFMPPDLPAGANLVLLCVPDDAIPAVALQLAAYGRIAKECLVAHCSGAHGASLLAPLQHRTIHLASLHPMQMFSGAADDPGRLQNIYFALEGEQTAVARLQALVTALKSQAVLLTQEQKELYHIACVFASNYMMACQSVSAEIMAWIGFSEGQALSMLTPLTKTAVEQAGLDSLSGSMTGPVVRGDAGTIRLHLEALNAYAPHLQALYAELGNVLLRMEEKKYGSLSEKQKSVADIFTKHIAAKR